MSLADALRQYLRDAMPGGALNREISRERLSGLGKAMMGFTPVVGGVVGAQAEWQAGNPGMAAINAATVPLDAATMGIAGMAARSGTKLLRAKHKTDNLLPGMNKTAVARRLTPFLDATGKVPPGDIVPLAESAVGRIPQNYRDWLYADEMRPIRGAEPGT